MDAPEVKATEYPSVPEPKCRTHMYGDLWGIEQMREFVDRDRAARPESVDACIEWIRNHYQDHPNIDSLCAAMRWDLLPRMSADGGKDIPL